MVASYHIISSHSVVVAIVTSVRFLAPLPHNSLRVYHTAWHLMFKNLFLATWIPVKSTQSEEEKTKAGSISLTTLRSAEQLKSFQWWESCSLQPANSRDTSRDTRSRGEWTRGIKSTSPYRLRKHQFHFFITDFGAGSMPPLLGWCSTLEQ